MKKPWEKGLLILAGALLAAGWLWQYQRVNAFYRELNNTTTEVYEIGMEVPFEDDYVGSKEPAKGYTLRVDDFRIVDCSEFIREQGFTLPEEYGFPEKLALVSLTLRNIDSTAPGITLLDLTLSGIDQNAGIDWDLLPLLNPVLENSYRIALHQGTDCQVVIPYQLYRYSFSAAWDDLENYPLFFQMTSHPTRKRIQVQGE